MTFLNIKKPYIFAFLVFSVASSKHIIIYNEELLVALTFLAFVFYIKVAFGNSIKESIDESRNSILQELQSSRVHKKHGAENLKTIHEKVSPLYDSLQSIENYVYFLVRKVGSIAKKSINRISRQQIQYRCEGAQMSEKFYFHSIGEKMSESFFPGILVYTQKSINKKKGQKSNSYKTAKKGILLLKKNF